MKKSGICHICLKETELTFEHIPPESAFNNERSKAITGEEFIKTVADTKRKPWDFSDLKYEQKQRGMGLHSLCKDCNNKTGALYVNEYMKFANTIDMFYSRYDIKVNENFHFMITDISPIRFAKEILAMFCSTIDYLAKNHPIIPELILDKNKRGLDTDKYRLGMFLIRNKRIGYTGISALGNIYNKGIRVVASIDAYPFGFTLDFNPNKDIEYKELDITSFLNSYSYDDLVQLEFSVPVFERNIMFPTDYRKKDEIDII